MQMPMESKPFWMYLTNMVSTIMLLSVFSMITVGADDLVYSHHTISDFESRAAKIWNIDTTLLDTLCQWETRKWAERANRTKSKIERDYYETKRNNSHNWLDAVGRCQVRIITAADLLGLNSSLIPPRTFEFIRRALLDPHINAYFAAWVLSRCIELKKKYKNNLERALFCYNEGPRKKWKGPTNFTKNVLHKYGNARLEHFYKGL